LIFVKNASTAVGGTADNKTELITEIRYLNHEGAELTASFRYILWGNSIHLNNEQPDSPLLLSFSVRRALAHQVLQKTGEIAENCLLGRTVHGLAFEFFVHYFIHMFVKKGRIGRAVDVTDSGGLIKGVSGYDSNAWVFEDLSGCIFRIRYYLSQALKKRN